MTDPTPDHWAEPPVTEHGERVAAAVRAGQAEREAWLAAGPDSYEKEATAAFRHCTEQDAQVWAGTEAEAG